MSCLSNHYDRRGGKCLLRALALFVALAVTPPVLHAQEWDHLNGRDKVHDPTGVWLVNTSLLGPDGKPLFFIINFHRGGTLTQDIQGESAFDPTRGGRQIGTGPRLAPAPRSVRSFLRLCTRGRPLSAQTYTV
jgi:hypothetical protein